MRAAERGEEIVEDIAVGQIDYFHASAELVAITVEMVEVIIANRQIEQIALLDARWIMVVVLLVGRRNRNEGGTKLRSRADTARYRDASRVCRARGRSAHTVASEPGLELLIGAQRYAAHVRGYQRNRAVGGGRAAGALTGVALF